MPIDFLKEENLDSVLALHQMGMQGSMFLHNVDAFRARCEASISHNTMVLQVSDDFGAREIEISPRIYTYDIQPVAGAEDLFIGCATAYRSTREHHLQANQSDVTVTDFCLMPNFYQNDIINRFIKQLSESIFHDFRPSTISMHIIQDSFHFEDLENALTRNFFVRNLEPREQLVWHDPPLTRDLPPGIERRTRNIRRYVLDVQSVIDPIDGFRERPINRP